MNKRIILLALLFITAKTHIYAQNNNEGEKWNSTFEKYKVNGTFVLHSLSSGKSEFYNKARSDSSFLPASTFKILNSLIALETNSVCSINDTIKWDGIDRGWDKWNCDQSMKTAMPFSCIWFYQELARRVGKETMQKWINEVKYGNTKMGAQIDNFWLEGALRISANEQIKFIERLIKNKLPFDIDNQKIVKELMIMESTKDYVLHAKTGWAMRVKKQVGWYVGYVVAKNQIWIFAMNMDIKKKSDARYRKQITYEILEKEGIIKK